MKKHIATLAVASTALALTTCSSGNPHPRSAPPRLPPAPTAATPSTAFGSAHPPP